MADLRKRDLTRSPAIGLPAILAGALLIAVGAHDGLGHGLIGVGAAWVLIGTVRMLRDNNRRRP